MGLIHLILLALGLLAGYVLLVLVSPLHRCPRCKGTRIDRTGMRPRACRHCWLTGMRYRPGAQLIHKVFWSVAGDRYREAQRERAEQYAGANEEEETP
jgi:hypothetical protein